MKYLAWNQSGTCPRIEVVARECQFAPVFVSIEAVFSEADLPDGQGQFTEINARLAKQWPVITVETDPLPDANEWDGVKGKIKYLDE